MTVFGERGSTADSFAPEIIATDQNEQYNTTKNAGQFLIGVDLMNKKYWIRFLAIALSLSIVLGSNIAHGQQFPRSLTIGIFRLPQIDGSTTFEASIPGSPPTGIIHLPNGELVTDYFPPKPHLGNFIFNSFSELKATLVGEWTIEVMRPGVPHEEYKFEVSDFPQSIFFAVPPNIVSPVDGSLVPPEFAMTWAWPLGVTPPSHSAALTKRFGPGSRFSSGDKTRLNSNELSAEITAEHANGDLAQRLELRAGSFHPDVLADFVSEVTPQQDPSRYSYTIHMNYFNHSAPVQVIVGVPGDYNDNGVVDAADYAVWKDSMGQTGADLLADGNRNGEIDAGDFDVWRANFGASMPTSATTSAVPEPIMWTSISATLAWFLARRQRFQRVADGPPSHCCRCSCAK